MRANALKNTINSGAKVVESIAASKDVVSDALHEGKDTVTQFLKDTRHTAEDLLDEATHNIKRFPLGSVLMAFSVGAVFGILISRNGRD
ncbi:MAG TPA: hypothetical protein VNV82_23905 [Bryobacteraceae bacterium]|jgi:ElaB/YqjD/DUF883 family membrane-anchored ribosome-binding protein|nr:hypothetical protein [Bryobacteraceae bacterium]